MPGQNYTAEEKAAWDAGLQRIQNDIHPASFDTWFRPLTLFAVTPTAIVMEINDSFALSQLKGRYYTMLYSVMANAFGGGRELEFHTHDELVRQRVVMEKSMLNPRYTFENFVVGASNRFAHAAALAVAEQPSDVYNPLFIYGGVGLGKTHLMNAIGNFISAANPGANVLFISSETFTNELIETIVKKKGSAELRNRMRNVDVLMVDDIQFLSRTVATQEEFFHTFNHLHARGKQIIISSDRPPKDIPTIEERLRSRFEWGLIVDIQKPDFETRVAILRKKAEEENIDVPYEVVEYIAERVESNIRELEGSLTRVNAQATLMGVPITVELAQDALSQFVKARDVRRITPELIIRTVAEQYGIPEEDMTSKRRSREVALPRQIAMYLTRELTQLSTTSIGAAFGGRDHTTVMHGCEKIADSMKGDTAFRRRVEELIGLVKNA